MPKPSKFAHVVYRTRRFDEMIRWYQDVFDAEVQFQNAALAFLTYDDEHHRFALANLDAFDPEGKDDGARSQVGVDHVAYTYPEVGDLVDQYERLREVGVKPYWCVHHGLTLSMYYRDPDGNQMEFQVDCFKPADARAFIQGDVFAQNPVGVPFDPDALAKAFRAGEDPAQLLQRADAPAPS